MRDLRSALLRMADEAFFELVRNYLGPIRTPFNKHDLLDRLERFLKQETNQKRIIQLVDESDAQLLTAIWILGEPRLDDVHASFGGGSYLDLHQQLLNLEDRLLVYRDEDQIAINPVLLPVLENEVLRADRVFAFRGRTADDPEPAEPWLNDSLLAAFYALVAESGELFKTDGALRKRNQTDIEARIPSLLEPIPGSADGVSRVRVLADSLIAAGAVTETNGLQVADDRWSEIAALSPSRRSATLIAALALGRDSPPGTLAAAIEHLIDTLAPDRLVEPQSVERLLLILDPARSSETLRRTREAMTATGFFARTADDFLAPARPTSDQESDTAKPIVIEPNFDVTVPAGTRFADVLSLARLARLSRHDRYSHYELTKDRFAAALQSGVPFADLVARLRMVTAGRLPSNIVTTLESWAAEFESVQLFRGIVLRVEEARRFAVEHSQTIQSLVKMELAPGVYLFGEGDVPQVQEALADAGVELIPEVLTPRGAAAEFTGSLPAPPATGRRRTFERIMASALARSEQEDPSVLPERASADWLDELHAKLDSSRLSSDQKEAMRGRIDQKLILSPDQIANGTMKIEKTEAKGLDYVGKVRIIEQAVRSGVSLLEIIERTEDGLPVKRLVEPIELEKGGNDLVLVAEQLPEREEIRVRVRKLGLVRRLRSGLVRRRPSRR